MASRALNPAWVAVGSGANCRSSTQQYTGRYVWSFDAVTFYMVFRATQLHFKAACLWSQKPYTAVLGFVLSFLAMCWLVPMCVQDWASCIIQQASRGELDVPATATMSSASAAAAAGGSSSGSALLPHTPRQHRLRVTADNRQQHDQQQQLLEMQPLGEGGLV